MSTTTTTTDSAAPSTRMTGTIRSSLTAQAFFAALDNTSSALDSPTTGTSISTTKRAKAPTSSAFIRKLTQSLGWRNRYSQDEFYPISLQDSSGENHCFRVLQVQRGEIEGTYGTGATVWPASMVLIKYLQVNEHLIRDKTVVDLGSGTAVTSIAAALLGAGQVFCTDGERSVVQLATDNVRRAQEECPGLASASPIQVLEYWWGSGTPPINGSVVDVVLVSDCVLPRLYPIAPLVDAIHQLLTMGSPKAVAILSYEHRWYPEYDPRDKFRELAHEKGMTVTVIAAHLQDPVYSTDDIEIWHVQKKVLEVP